jgi:hypothetical protein
MEKEQGESRRGREEHKMSMWLLFHLPSERAITLIFASILAVEMSCCSLSCSECFSSILCTTPRTRIVAHLFHISVRLRIHDSNIINPTLCSSPSSPAMPVTQTSKSQNCEEKRRRRRRRREDEKGWFTY